MVAGAARMKIDAQRMLDSMLAAEDSDDSSDGSDYPTEEADGPQHLVMHRRGSAPAQWLKADGSAEPASRSESFEPQGSRKETDGAMITQQGEESEPGRNILPTPGHERRSVSFGEKPPKVRQTARTCIRSRSRTLSRTRSRSHTTAHARASARTAH